MMMSLTWVMAWVRTCCSVTPLEPPVWSAWAGTWTVRARG